MSGPRQDRGGRLHRSSASSLPNDPRLRRNAQGGTTDYEFGAGIRDDGTGRYEVGLDEKSGLFYTPRGDIALKVAGVLAIKAGSPYAVVMQHDGTLVENKQGELSAQPDFSRVRANSRETNGATLKDVLDGEVELRKRRGQPGGYAKLDEGGRVPTAELGTGTADANSLLFGDQTFKTAVPASAMTEVLALSDLTDVAGKTGTGTTVVMDTEPEITGATLLAPGIGDFTNAPHSHQDAAGAGSLDAAAIGSGTFALARIGEVLALDNLSDVSAKTGSGATVVMDDSPEIATPTLTAPLIDDFSSALHNHESAARGGALDAAAIATGTFPLARIDEVLALSNLSDVTAKTGSGTTVAMSVGPTLTDSVLTDAVPNQFRDANGAVILGFNATPSTTNWVEVTNAATLTAPTVAAAGADTNIDLNLAAKGVGNVRVGGQIVETRNAKGAASGYIGADVNGQVESSSYANKSVTWPKVQDATETDVAVGRFDAGAGSYQEFPFTAAGRALVDDATAAAQRTTLGLGAVALLSTLSEQIALADLTDVTAKTGSGTTVAMSTSPTLTTPRVSGSIDDSTGTKLLKLTPAASAVNFLELRNATAPNPIALEAVNGAAYVDLQIIAENMALFATALTFNGAAVETQDNKGAISGYASLNASSLVVQNPANATATPTASKIIIADGFGKADGWVSDASTTVKGKVELATSAEVTAGLAVQASDTRLSDARTPSGAAGGSLGGTYPSPTIAAASTTAVGLVELSTDGEESATTALVGTDNRLIKLAETEGRSLRSVLPCPGTGFPLISGTAYFVYLGRITKTSTFKFVRLCVRTGGSGAQTAEVGFFSTPAAPSRANQTVTKLAATGTVSDLTLAVVGGNTSSLNISVTAGTHLWAGIRTAMATTQPSIFGLIQDLGQGRVLSTAASGALTGAGPWTGALITEAGVTLGPNLEGSLD